MHTILNCNSSSLIIIIMRNLDCASKCRSKLRSAGHCNSAGRMTKIMRHVAEARCLKISPARQGTILNNHRVICIATNKSMVLNGALVTNDNSRGRATITRAGLTYFGALG